MDEPVLTPRHGSVTIRPIYELIDDMRCGLFGETEESGHEHCLMMAASWPDPGAYADLEED